MPRVIAILLTLRIISGMLPAEAEQVTIKPEIDLHEFLIKEQGIVIYGLYLLNRKVGWYTEELRLGKHGEKEVAVKLSEMSIKIEFNAESIIFSKMKRMVCYELHREGQIIYAEESKKTNEGNEEYTATREGHQLRVVKTQNGRKTVTHIPMSKDTLTHSRAFKNWLRSPRTKGDSFNSYSFDFKKVQMGKDYLDSKEEFQFLEKKIFHLQNIKTELIQGKCLYNKYAIDVFILPDGRIWKGKIGPIDLRMEEEDTAKNHDVLMLEFPTEILVQTDMKDPEQVDYLVLEFSNFGNYKFPESHRQQVFVHKDDRIVIKIKRDYKINDAKILSKEKQKKYLEVNDYVQSSHPKIRSLAKKIVNEKKEPIKMAEAIQNWVHHHITPSYKANTINALKVLENRKGDCTEYSLLFVALARAVGIPSREVVGLVFSHEVRPCFCFHAWAQIYDGKQWVSVDPAWNQIFVDATHVTLATEQDDFKWFEAFQGRKIKIKVESFKLMGSK